MIGYLRGTVIDKSLGTVLLDVQGVGYQVFVTSRLIDKAILNHELVVFTHLAVREDALTLFGLASFEERQLFELLISISGIGPKIGLAVLSVYTPAEVTAAISQGQATAFSAVPGIGKKNAERIILELKNKVAAIPGSSIDTVSTSGTELSQALVSLGYSPVEAFKAAEGIDSSLALSDQIKAALKKLARQ